MNTWVLQMGFPVVTINTTNGQVSQQHFLLDPDSEVTTPSSFGYVHPPSRPTLLLPSQTLLNSFLHLW